MTTIERPERTCEICGETDRLPRHVHTERQQVHNYHYICHAAEGCETCINALEATQDG